MKQNMTFNYVADLVLQLTGNDVEVAKAEALLRRPMPDPFEAKLDSHVALLKRHFDAVEAAIDGLPQGAIQILEDLSGNTLFRPILINTGDDQVVDRLALNLIHNLEPWMEEAKRLAVALARFVEDSPRLHTRQTQPLGRGFEHFFDDRLQRRFDLLPHQSNLLLLLHNHLGLLLEEPDEGRWAIEQELGTPLTEQERIWLDVERRVATLRFVRQRAKKFEGGHIRWFVRPDEKYGFILDRLGVRGHWLIWGEVEEHVLARLGTAVERVVNLPPLNNGVTWHLVNIANVAADDVYVLNADVRQSPFLPSGSSRTGKTLFTADDAFVIPVELATLGDASSMRQQVRQTLTETVGLDPTNIQHASLITDAQRALSSQMRRGEVGPTEKGMYSFEIKGQDHELCLWVRSNGVLQYVVDRVSCQGTDDELLSFLEHVNRVADLAIPTDRTNMEFEGGLALACTRALLKLRADREVVNGGKLSARRVRLVYIPSSISHQFGGVPEVGTAYLRDHLEREGDQVDVLTIAPEEFDQKLVELLGADVVGIGVYIHNRHTAAILVSKLRQAGFMGKIVLGGPETRNIDAVQTSITGWDAIIRGEAEEILPRVLNILDHFSEGQLEVGLKLARQLQGVIIRCGNAVLLCDTATRNRASVISCPLPFDWGYRKQQRILKMNFTRGCPYDCEFCPLHQGFKYRSGPVDELWRYSILAVADDLTLPVDVEKQVTQVIQNQLHLAEPVPLRVGLYLLWRSELSSQDLSRLVMALEPLIDPRVFSDGNDLDAVVGVAETLHSKLEGLKEKLVSIRDAKETWLYGKLTVLASRQLWKREGSHEDLLNTLKPRLKSRFVLETSEDNTLVNRREIIEYMRRRKAYGLTEDFIFNPGQNTIWDLTRRNGQNEADEEYIALLADDNPFAVALGTDGPSNTIIRQNNKPRYGVADVLVVNRALARHSAKKIANNYILLTPETSLIEAVEAFLLFLLLPVPWRDYDTNKYPSINLRVIKEETTLSNDEGLIFAPEDEGYDCPFRFHEVQELIDRWKLTSMVSSKHLRPILWWILEKDQAAAAMVPLVIERWKRNLDADPELAALAELVSSESCNDEALLQALRRIEARVQAEGCVGGRTLATFRDLAHPSSSNTSQTCL